MIAALKGYRMKLLMPERRSTDNKLIISVALLFAFCGVCTLLDVSPLLGCMAMGTVYTNVAENDKLFKQLGYFSPPILLLFFVRSGMNFKLDALFSASGSLNGVPLIAVGVGYFLVRIVGKYIGAWVGCAAVKKGPARPQLSRSRAHPAGGRRDRPCRARRANARRCDGKRPGDDHPRLERFV